MKVFVLLCLIVAAYGMQGVDVSSPISASAWQCLNKQGYDFAVVRCFMSTGSPDPSCPGSVSAAQGVLSNTDIYMFPCPTCSASAADQINTLAQYIKSNNIQYNRLWFDIEDTPPNFSYWNSDISENQAFFEGLVQAAQSAGMNIGVYSDEYMWGFVMTNSYTGGSSLPLWYSNYDNQLNYDDFSPFAGWSTPFMKQYSGTTGVCGVGVDQNWLPGGNETTGPSSSSTSGPSSSTSGNSTATSGNSTATSGPNTATSGNSTATSGPNTATSGPNTATSGNSTSTSGPSTATSGNSTSTSGYTAGTGTGKAGGPDFHIGGGSIYTYKKGTAHKMKVTPNANKAKARAEEVEGDHIKIWEEKSQNKF